MKMQYIFIILFITSVLIPATASANHPSTSHYCINSTTLYHEESEVVTVAAPPSIEILTINYTTTCIDGCAYNSCLPLDDNSGLIASTIIIAIIIFSFIFIGMKVDGEAKVLSYIFIPLSLIFSSVGLFNVIEMKVLSPGMNAVLSATMYGLLIVFILLIVIMMVLFIQKLMAKNLPYGPKPKEEF